jgi:predicted MarR family transcription regulator
MGYKQIEPNMTSAEVSLLKSMEHNRSLKRLEKINQVINWSKVEDILMAHYTVSILNFCIIFSLFTVFLVVTGNSPPTSTW